ncbi:hypothetical protein [Plantactinospora sp. CA-290183]|uniref:hypothetical protein n=1 Tax=Plantactinospora sp. CA-290183 TaxID=3240006 RepID=UPI003D8D6DE2
MSRPVRSLAPLAVLCVGIPAGLFLALVWLDGSRYGGYRPELSELTGAATVVAAVLALLLGYLHGAEIPADADRSVLRRRLLLVLGVGAAATALTLLANDALYRYVVPLDADLTNNRSRPAGPWLAGMTYPVLVGALGYGLGLLRRQAAAPTVDGPQPPPGRRWLLAAVAVAVGGLLVVPDFVRVGAELATGRFVPDGAVTVAGGQRTTVPLAPGRHAVFRLYGGDMSTSQCDLVDARGGTLPLSEPSVLFTDNSDSVVTVLLGTFDVPGAGPVTVTCQDGPYDTYQVGGLPEIRGPLTSLVYGPAALPPLIGVLPGVLFAGWLLIRRRVKRDGDRVGP